MRIKTITSQSRRDFYALYECEHCGTTDKGSGYDDANFHNNVIPRMVCKACGQAAPIDHRPLAPKYADSVVIYPRFESLRVCPPTRKRIQTKSMRAYQSLASTI